MDKNRIDYSAEDFAQDIQFINWVNKGIYQKEWNNFVHKNPNLSIDIDMAKKIVTALRYNSKDLQDEKIYETYKNIEIFFIRHHKSGRAKRFMRWMNYDALFVFVLAIGALIPYIYFTISNNRYTELQLSTPVIKEEKLIRYVGEEI